MKALALLLFIFVTGVAAECPSDTMYDSIMDRCYKYVRAPMAYIVAEQFCLDTNGLLIVMKNITENMFVAEMSGAFLTGSSFWIGLNNLNGKYEWDSGANLTFTSWAPGQPTSTSSQCVVSSVTKGLWTATECSGTYEFVCAYAAHPSTTPRPTTTPKPRCPANYVYYEQTKSCYYVGHSMPFYQAESTCNSMGGHLASILSAFENSFIISLTSTGGTKGERDMTWIGLHYDGTEWVWMDETEVIYKNWEPGMPSDSFAKEEYCVELLQDEFDKHKGVRGTWDNQACTDTMKNFVCKRDAY